MEKDFETLITGFIEDQIGVSEHFINDQLAYNLSKNLLSLHQHGLLHVAGIGDTANLTHDDQIRSDSIYWLDRKNNNVSENEYLDLMEQFIRYLNMSCNTGITNYEFHYALYESGSFYKKHLDQFQNNSNRQYSLISYLNANWIKTDGGELLIQKDSNEQSISPTLGKTVFFKSNELYHEVMPTQKRRMSITGWLKK